MKYRLLIGILMSVSFAIGLLALPSEAFALSSCTSEVTREKPSFPIMKAYVYSSKSPAGVLKSAEMAKVILDDLIQFGNGINDNQAIMKAVEALPAPTPSSSRGYIGGREVELSSGPFMGGKISIKDKPNTAIGGQGWSTYYTLANGTNDHAFEFINSNFSTIRDMQIDGNRNNQTKGDLIHVENSYQWRQERVRLLMGKDRGTYLLNSNSWHIEGSIYSPNFGQECVLAEGSSSEGYLIDGDLGYAGVDGIYDAIKIRSDKCLIESTTLGKATGHGVHIEANRTRVINVDSSENGRGGFVNRGNYNLYIGCNATDNSQNKLNDWAGFVLYWGHDNVISGGRSGNGDEPWDANNKWQAYGVEEVPGTYANTIIGVNVKKNNLDGIKRASALSHIHENEGYTNEARGKSVISKGTKSITVQNPLDTSIGWIYASEGEASINAQGFIISLSENVTADKVVYWQVTDGYN